MKGLDRFLQRARIARCRPYLRRGDTVLDVGCADGALFLELRGYIGRGIGIDPTLTEPVRTETYELIPGRFPDAVPAGVTCDVITMLAVVEHLAPEDQARLAVACDALLGPGGRVVITVPSPRVDDILHVLTALRLVDGMSVHEHHGFRPSDTPGLFPPPRFRLVDHRRFQLGLNNLYVFEKATAA